MPKVTAAQLKHPLRSSLHAQREAIRRGQAASRFALSGLSVPSEGVTQVDGDLVVVGDFTADGKVTNTALTDPIVAQVANLQATNFSITASFAEKVGVDLTVPDNCTRLQVTVTCIMQAYNQNTTGGNNGAGGDYIYVYAKIASTSGYFNAMGVSGNGGAASTFGALSGIVSGLSAGDSVRIGGWGASQYTTISADPTNKFTLTAAISWLR